MPPIIVNWQVGLADWTEYSYADFRVTQELDKPEGYGVSYFWFCRHCGERYAEAKIEGRIWQALSGVCTDCNGDRWVIPGTLECLPFVGWNVPEAIIRYQLVRELAFLDDPQHPYNEKETT